MLSSMLIVIRSIGGEMGSLLDPVVWETQVGNAPANDCGAACLAMLLKAYKAVPTTTTVADIYYSILPGGVIGLNMPELLAYMTSKGLPGAWETITNPDQVYPIMRSRKPSIALIHYGVLVDAGLTQFINFRAGHFVLIVGIDLDFIYIHDPDHSDTHGAFKQIPIGIFFEALRECYLDGDNPQYQLLVPSLPIQDLSKPNSTLYKVNKLMIPNAIRIHASASDASATIGYLYVGVNITLVSYNPTGYCQIKDGPKPGGFVWGPYLVSV